MSYCPFMSNGKDPRDWCGCIASCELRINNSCALKVLAQKAIHDAKKQKSDEVLQSDNGGTDSTG